MVRGGKNEMQEESTSHRYNPIHTTDTVGENAHSHTMRGGGKFRRVTSQARKCLAKTSRLGTTLNVQTT